LKISSCRLSGLGLLYFPIICSLHLLIGDSMVSSKDYFGNRLNIVLLQPF